MYKPLEGIKVVELGYFVAGPSAGMNLADWGADVVKVEPPFGDPGHRRGADGKITTRDEYFNVYNRHKRDLVLDTRDPRGVEAMYKLLEQADVFVTSLRPKGLAKMGFDWDTLHAKYPRLVYAEISGFGEEGPDANNPGFDTVAFWARSGAQQDIVNRGNDVVIPPVAFGDLLTGAMLAGGVGTALFDRERTGQGQKVSLSLFGMGTYALSYFVFASQTGSEFPVSHLEPELPMMNSFKCGDGKWIFMANVDHEKHYNDFMRAFGRDDLVDDERFASRTNAQINKVEFTKVLDGEFAKHTREECGELLTKADIAYNNINHAKDNINDEQLLANDYLLPMHMRDGIDVKVPSCPMRYGTDVHIPEGAGMGPLLGEHSKEVLESLGYTDEQIADLAKDKITIVR